MSLRSVTAFRGHHQLAAGPLPDVALAVWRAIRAVDAPNDAVLIFDDATGHVIDLEMRGDESDMLAHIEANARLQPYGRDVDAAGVESGALSHDDRDDRGALGAVPRPRGRPRLGVVAREVTLLPRHWEWLAAQPGGASVALRRLVDDARRSHANRDRALATRDAAYRFMHAIAGDLPQFEEATRALYRNDVEQLHAILDGWPPDVRAFVISVTVHSLR